MIVNCDGGQSALTHLYTFLSFLGNVVLYAIPIYLIIRDISEGGLSSTKTKKKLCCNVAKRKFA